MKNMNSQLGSWAQLRHDNILYVEQGMRFGTCCDYPGNPYFIVVLFVFIFHFRLVALVFIGFSLVLNFQQLGMWSRSLSFGKSWSECVWQQRR